MGALTWKPVELGDVDTIFNAIKGNVAEYFYDFQSKEEVHGWIQNAIKEHENGKKLEFMLYEDNEFVGMISPCYITKKCVEVGIWITQDKQGKGYGAKALSEMLEQLQKEGIEEVVYETESLNEPSIRLATSLGFKPTYEGDTITFIKNLSPHII